MTDKIILKGVRLMTQVGVPEGERGAAQEVVIDLELLHDIRAAAANDDFRQTVDYAAVRETLASVALARPRKLIETLAEEMVAAVLAEYPVEGVHLMVKKPAALRHLGVEYPAVEIVRMRVRA